MIGDGNLWFDAVTTFDNNRTALAVLKKEKFMIKLLLNNDVQIFDYDTIQPVRLPLNNQNESRYIIRINGDHLHEIVKRCLKELLK